MNMMIYKHLCFILISINLCLPNIHASEISLQAPFISYLDAVTDNSMVILEWRDASETDNLIYEIHRYGEQITSSNLNETELIAHVSPGIRNYIDRPDAGMPWWYAVISVVNGKPVNIAIPWRNVLGSPVQLSEISREYTETAVLNLTAEVIDGTVAIKFQTEGEGIENQKIIFRIAENFDHAVIVGRSSGKDVFIEDQPLPGILWSYAVVDSRLFDTGCPDWQEKAVISLPVFISAKDADFSDITPVKPLPFPEFESTPLREKRTLSPEAYSGLKVVLSPAEGRIWIPPEPEILTIEHALNSKSSQSSLKKIIDGPFSRGDWDEAESELFKLSAANGLEKNMKARIRFYTGECRYFQNNLEEAFLSFLVSSEVYYAESRRWMMRIYEDLTPVH